MKQEKTTGPDLWVKRHILTKKKRVVSPDRHKNCIWKLYFSQLLPHDGARFKYTRTAVKSSLEHSAEINSKTITSHFKFSVKVKQQQQHFAIYAFLYSCHVLNLRNYLYNILLSFSFFTTLRPDFEFVFAHQTTSVIYENRFISSQISLNWINLM